MTDSTDPRPPAPLAEIGNALVPTSDTACPAEQRWSRDRMADFILELAATQCVATAARAVGMSRQSAYRLRAREAGGDFDMAWTIALEQCFQRLYSAAMARAVNGTEVPVYQRGELIGSRRHFDERLTCYLLTRGSLRVVPMSRARREATNRWKGNFDEVVERVRSGEENV
jgi:hypothetical protein